MTNPSAEIVPFPTRGARAPASSAADGVGALEFAEIPGNRFKVCDVLRFIEEHRAALTFASIIASEPKERLVQSFRQIDDQAANALTEELEDVHQVLAGLADIVETTTARMTVVRAAVAAVTG